jgi:hypothetical protein
MKKSKGSGIAINPKNEGKFSEWAKRHGMGVQEAAQHVLANKDRYSSAVVKQANFARNAAKWKHAYGGAVPLMQQGGDVALEYDIDDIPSNRRKRFYWNDPRVDSVLQANKQLNFVDRYLYPTKYPVLARNDDGTESTKMKYDERKGYSTHSMMSADRSVFPTVVQLPDGSMKRLEPEDAINYALKTGEYIKFPTEAEAQKFAENGYKMGMRYWQDGGSVSTDGYKRDSPDRFNAFNIIPSNQITMKDVPHPVMGRDDLGNQRMMLPGYQYVFPGSYVTERPVPWSKMQRGGSVVDYLHSQGEDSSMAGRRQLASQLGIGNYRGTAAQNLQLLRMLRSGSTDRANQVQGPMPDDDTGTTPMPVVQRAPANPTDVHPKGGYVNLKDYGIDLYQKDGSYSPDALAFAKHVQEANPNTKVKFVCNEQGCFAVANRASQGLTGERLYGDAAWRPEGGKMIWQSPVLEQHLQNQGATNAPLPDPEDYSIPEEIRDMETGYVGLNRKNNRKDGMARTTKEANDSYDYANTQLYPDKPNIKNLRYEHMGFKPDRNTLIHGTGPGPGHPGFFVVDDLRDNEISLAGYGKYAPVAAFSTDRKAEPIPQMYRTPVVKKGNQLQYQLRPNEKDTEQQRQSKQRLIEYFNDPNLDKQLMETTGISPEDLQGLKPVMMGIMGNETSFNDPSTFRNIKEFFADMRSHPSVGPFEVKLESVPQSVRQRFGIDNNADLKKFEKAYPAALSVLYNALKTTDQAVAEGKQPGIKDKDRYFRAAYAYNMPAITRGGDERIEQLWQQESGGRGTPEERQQFFDKMRLRMEKGTYPYKAMQYAYDVMPVAVPSGQVRQATTPAPSPSMAVVPSANAMSQRQINPFQSNPFQMGTGTFRQSGGVATVKQYGGDYNPFSLNSDMASVFLAGTNPRLQNFFQQQQVMSKDNQLPIGMRDETNLNTQAMLETAPALRNFFQKPKILAKDSPKLMDDNTSTTPAPAPKVTIRTPDLLPALGTVAGLGIASHALEAKDRNRWKDWQRLRGLGDSIGPMVAGSRGDYTFNGGYFRPDQYTPVQYGAVPMAQMGGGYYDPPAEYMPLKREALQTEFEDPYSKMDTLLQQVGTGEAVAPVPEASVAAPAPEATAERHPSVPDIKPNMSIRPNKASWDAVDYYINEQGLDPLTASAIVANFFQESRLKPNAEEKEHTAEGMGVAQWNKNNRYLGMVNWAKKNNLDHSELKTQLLFALNEPGESDKALKAMKQARTPEDAAYVFGKVYERPSDKYARWDVRAGIARQLYEGVMARMNNSAQASGNQQGAVVSRKLGGSVMGFQEGGEYLVTPKQLEFILAHGGEVEFL